MNPHTQLLLCVKPIHYCNAMSQIAKSADNSVELLGQVLITDARSCRVRVVKSSNEVITQEQCKAMKFSKLMSLLCCCTAHSATNEVMNCSEWLMTAAGLMSY